MVDPDCQYGLVCRDQRCVERPDPCQPSPCGPGAVATRAGDTCECACPPGTVGGGYTGCRPGECTEDWECAVDKVDTAIHSRARHEPSPKFYNHGEVWF